MLQKSVPAVRKAFSRISLFVFSIFTLVYAHPAYAEEIKVFGTEMNADANQAAGQLADKLIGLVNLFAGFVGAVLFGVLVYAGFKIMTTGDNPQENARAKAIMLYGIGGAALVFFAWLLTKAVIGHLAKT
ncbi:hypothetical protein J2Z49_002880 [Desulfofundulus luciae]|uniref:TrbC/VIRB2 family protein n=1 Tax=Desulfofundulus luciae TaxID=74702 RepID=A0ABU0B4V5_9FIRM|nr:pilin [Desulfofundulus luciae]MDQ0287749.1 hypothetical protein [Desulfofundulus luciae]